MSQLAVDQIDQSVSMISLQGEHDLNSAPELRLLIGRVHRQGQGVVLDLSQTTFIDSSILAALIEAQRQARRSGVGLAVYTGAKLSDGVSRVLEITGLDGELGLWADRSAAVTAVREGLA